MFRIKLSKTQWTRQSNRKKGKRTKLHKTQWTRQQRQKQRLDETKASNENQNHVKFCMGGQEKDDLLIQMTV